MVTPILSPPQNCFNKQQLLAAIRQLQQVLKGQETRFTEGIRNMKSRLAALHSSVNRVGPGAPPGKVPPSVPLGPQHTQALPLWVPCPSHLHASSCPEAGPQAFPCLPQGAHFHSLVGREHNAVSMSKKHLWALLSII